MAKRRAATGTAVLACIAAAGLAGCAEQMKQFTSKPDAGSTPVAAATSTPQTLPPESRDALVVWDRNCPKIVQPYELTENVKETLTTTTMSQVKKFTDSFKDLLPGSTPRASARAGDIPDELRLSAKRVNWLPMAVEVQFGESSHATETAVLARDSKFGKQYYPIADDLLRQVLDQVTEKHDYQFKLYILKQDTRNALARPGGYLYLDEGLLKDPQQRSKAYFALAHEIAHVLQRHETKELQSMVVDSFAVRAELEQAIQNARSDPTAVLRRVKARKDALAKHHSDQELQADSCGTRLLSRVFPTRQGLSEAIGAFTRELPAPEPGAAQAKAKTPAEELAANTYEIVTTPAARHPTTQERLQNLQAMYEEVSKGLSSSASNP